MAISKEGEVSFLSREMVAPATPTQRHSYFLSCFDLVWKDHHYNRRVVFYEGTAGHEDGPAVVQKLKSSLARCLVDYYPWCGRLSPGHRLSIDCNDAGVEFVEASVDLPISLLSANGFQMKPFFELLYQKVDHAGDCLYSSPLLSIQATLFSDGGLALGIMHSHVVADGQSLWNFMVSWGECARRLPLSVPPVLDRERLAVPNPSPEKATWEFNPKMKEEDMADEDEEDALLHKLGESVETHSSLDKEAAEPISAGTSNEGSAGTLDYIEEASVPCVFNMPSSAVKNLKIQDGGVHTSHEVTCAHLWQRLTAARQRPSHEPTFFIVLVNCRSRVKPPLPPAYFGNAIAFGMAVSTSGKICSESIYATASRIHDVVVESIQDSLVSVMHWLETHEHAIIKEIIPKIPKGKGVNVASSPRFPVYEVDFGWGKPMAVRSPNLTQEIEMVFFGGHPKSTPGDVEICTGLPRAVLRRLLVDPLFLGNAPSNPFEDP